MERLTLKKDDDELGDLIASLNSLKLVKDFMDGVYQSSSSAEPKFFNEKGWIITEPCDDGHFKISGTTTYIYKSTANVGWFFMLNSKNSTKTLWVAKSGMQINPLLAKPGGYKKTKRQKDKKGKRTNKNLMR